MAYPLQILHEIIHKTVSPQQLLYAAETVLDLSAHCQQVEKEGENVMASFMQHAAAATDTKALKILVQTCEAGCISLANKLTGYGQLVADCSAAEEWKAKLQQHYRYMEELIINNLNCLQQYFPLAFDKDQYLPYALLRTAIKEIKPEWQKLTVQLRNSGANPALVTIILKPLDDFVNATPLHKYSYRQAAYFQVLITALEQTCMENTTGKINDCLMQRMLQLNFNEPLLLEYIVSLWRQEITEIYTLHDGLDKWALHLKNVQQVYTITDGLQAGKKSAAALLAEIIQHEITYIQSKLQVLASIYQTPVSSVAEPKSVIHTSLSVSQLAVMAKLLVDCNIIQNSNHTGLMKLIAGAFKTNKAGQISAESLRVKFYTPEPAAINIVREYLHQMLNHLKKY